MNYVQSLYNTAVSQICNTLKFALYIFISESQFALDLQSPDDLSFKVSTIMNVLKFSDEQWHEFGLIVALSLQDIADCWSSQSLNCNYQNALLQRWISTDYTASWYTLITAVKAMLPPACDYADSIVQEYPSLAKITEKELKGVEEIIPPSEVFTNSNEIPTVHVQNDEMDVERAIANVSRAIDERFKDIQDVLNARTEQIKKLSMSKDYWERQAHLDNQLIHAISNQNDQLEILIQKTDQLCRELFRDHTRLTELMHKVQDECILINSMDDNVCSKQIIFEELHKQCNRLQILKSKNAERLAAICTIPSKVAQLQETARKNHEKCKNEDLTVIVAMKRQSDLLNKYIALLDSTTQRLNGVVQGITALLELWKEFFTRTSQAAYGAVIGGGIGVAAGFALAFITGGAILPALAFAGAVGLGGAATGGAIGWSTYENQGHQNASIIRNGAEMSNSKRARLAETCTALNSQIDKTINSL